jgi:two-component system, cell cycle response regulator DivK
MANMTTPQPISRQNSKTILVVEDNELNLKLFGDLLGAAGFHVVAARDGMQAMAALRQQRPDLVVMDIQLPEVSGLEVTRWIRADAALSSVPVLAMSAFAMFGDESRIRTGGCDAYMAKPIVSARAFLAAVRELLGEPAEVDDRLFGAARPRPQLRAVR